MSHPGHLARPALFKVPAPASLYNLFNASQAIQTGRARIAIVGGADAPIVPEVVEGFRAMSALADEAGLRALDNLEPEEAVNWRAPVAPLAITAALPSAKPRNSLC